LLFVGRLIKEKGVFNLLSAVERIKDLGQEFTLDICGEGPEQYSIAQFINIHKLTGQINLHSFQEKIDQFYSVNSVLVLPSVREGMPNVAFEACSKGLLLILSNIPAHTRWFEDKKTALFFDIQRPESLAEVILYYFNMSDTEKNEMIECALDIVRGLSIDRFTERMESTYADIVKTKR
jgi:galacturonosyltransferase